MGFFKKEDKLNQAKVTSSNRSVNNNIPRTMPRTINRVDPFTCRYCGQVGLIGGDIWSPVGVHMAIVGSPDKCVYCGSNDYGRSCNFSPEYPSKGRGPHRHGHDGKHCIYCGLEGAFGKGCSFSPDGYHSL